MGLTDVNNEIVHMDDFHAKHVINMKKPLILQMKGYLFFLYNIFLHKVFL